MNAITITNPASLPTLADERHERDMKMIVDMFQELRGCGSPHIVDAAERLVESGELARLRRDAEERGRRATETEISMHLAALVGCYPTAKMEGQIYGRHLVEDVIAAGPSIGAIEAATRHLRRTSKWLPTISEILAAIEEAENAVRSAQGVLARLPAALSRARDVNEWQREQRRERCERQRADIRRRLEDGKSVELCDADLVAKVESEMVAEWREDQW